MAKIKFNLKLTKIVPIMCYKSYKICEYQIHFQLNTYLIHYSYIYYFIYLLLNFKLKLVLKSNKILIEICLTITFLSTVIIVKFSCLVFDKKINKKIVGSGAPPREIV